VNPVIFRRIWWWVILIRYVHLWLLQRPVWEEGVGHNVIDIPNESHLLSTPWESNTQHLLVLYRVHRTEPLIEDAQSGRVVLGK